MKISIIISPVETQNLTFNGKVGKSVYRYYEMQRQKILEEKSIDMLDIDTFKELVPQTLKRLNEFMDKLHPDTFLEFAFKENSNSIVPYFYNKKTDTSLKVSAPSNHRPSKRTIFLGVLNLMMRNFSPNFIRENIKTIDDFSTDLLSLTSQEGNLPKDIDDELFRKMFSNMAGEIDPTNFLSDFRLKRNAKKLEKLAPEFDVVSQNYPKQLFDAKVDLEEISKKQLAKKQEKQKIIDDFKSFEIK